MFGVFAFESPYIEKNKDWSSQKSHKKFGDSCPKQHVDRKNKIEKRYDFNFYVFYFYNLIKLIIFSLIKILTKRFDSKKKLFFLLDCRLKNNY